LYAGRDTSQRPGDPVTVGLIVAGPSEQDVAHDDTLLGEAPPGPEENQPGNPADPLALGLGGLPRHPLTSEAHRLDLLKVTA
jgi:hypothetical protein